MYLFDLKVFLGQKYGYRPIPNVIPASELDALAAVLKSPDGTVSDDARLLAQWYQRDLNAVPPVYALQPISSILTNFNNKVMSKTQLRIVFFGLAANKGSRPYSFVEIYLFHFVFYYNSIALSVKLFFFGSNCFPDQS